MCLSGSAPYSSPLVAERGGLFLLFCPCQATDWQWAHSSLEGHSFCRLPSPLPVASAAAPSRNWEGLLFSLLPSRGAIVSSLLLYLLCEFLFSPAHTSVNSPFITLSSTTSLQVPSISLSLGLPINTFHGKHSSLKLSP